MINIIQLVCLHMLFDFVSMTSALKDYVGLYRVMMRICTVCLLLPPQAGVVLFYPTLSACLLPTALAWKVMHSLPSVPLSIRPFVSILSSEPTDR